MKMSVTTMEDQRLSVSYANFLIANGVVMMPTFQDDRDRVAIDILQREVQDCTVIGIDCIDCVDLVWGLGALHCISQQENAVSPAAYCRSFS